MTIECPHPDWCCGCGNPNCLAYLGYESWKKNQMVFAREFWFSLPLKLRQRWWRETDYNKHEPSAELMKEIKNMNRNTENKFFIEWGGCSSEYVEEPDKTEIMEEILKCLKDIAHTLKKIAD